MATLDVDLIRQNFTIWADPCFVRASNIRKGCDDINVRSMRIVRFVNSDFYVFKGSTHSYLLSLGLRAQSSTQV